ncbi:hypothetical protein AtubIFM55763_001445 [Aspergillus tubingensis]|uniref:Uncharacterized protein n=1 Tax=Aspergillus tubingensis TaxID=5068 RepID=A0A9W6AVB5_ASPTU|nr:hypothetical protein AtubIFM55763_001445 [Aspergillus tubingensis]GLA86360.1 hypothetical protein AtubIFM56815_010622 [Aspergillus tubingensis]GLB01509.1 hypothetical protein AtubIFM57143_000941 [Aspergillus tubingensis]GLB19789.1 hypothetical protein AtubIFM61612_009708 [Aspergillus tubingensis]
MNITNSTMEQDRCAGHSGTPTLSYPYYCAIAIWQQGLNRTQDPYADLVNCCKSNQYSYYGEDNCAAYCNATKDTQSTLMDCLTEGHRFQTLWEEFWIRVELGAQLEILSYFGCGS